MFIDGRLAKGCSFLLRGPQDHHVSNSAFDTLPGMIDTRDPGQEDDFHRYLSREDTSSSDVSVCENLQLITIRRTRFPFRRKPLPLYRSDLVLYNMGHDITTSLLDIVSGQDDAIHPTSFS